VLIVAALDFWSRLIAWDSPSSRWAAFVIGPLVLRTAKMGTRTTISRYGAACTVRVDGRCVDDAMDSVSAMAA